MERDNKANEDSAARNESNFRYKSIRCERYDEKTFINHLDIRDYKFDFNYKSMKNPAELLKELIPLKEDNKLSNDEKINEVKKIVTKFLE